MPAEQNDKELRMKQSFTTETLSTLFSFPFKDARWVPKILIGSLFLLFSFLILPIFFIYGYFFEILRNAIEDRDPVLPEWDQFEKKFVDGAKLFLVTFIYTLPYILLFLLAFMLISAGSFSTELVGSDIGAGSIPWFFVSLFGSFGGLFIFGVSMLIGLVLGALLPVALAHMVAKDDLMAGFHVSEWWKIFRANTSGFLISYLIVMACLLLINTATQILNMTIVLCCLTPFISIALTFYLMVVANVIFGQAYRAAVENLSSLQST
jgi:hypothetical protein